MEARRTTGKKEVDSTSQKHAYDAHNNKRSHTYTLIKNSLQMCIISKRTFSHHTFSLSLSFCNGCRGAKRCQMHLNASNQPFSSFVENSRVAPYPFTTYLDSPIVPWGHSRAFWNSSRSSLSGKNIQCHRQPEFTKIGFFCCCCPP